MDSEYTSLISLITGISMIVAILVPSYFIQTRYFKKHRDKVSNTMNKQRTKP